MARAALKIDEAMILRVARAFEDFEYFLDEYVWIEDKTTQQPIKLKLWDSQRSKLPEFLQNRLVTILKAHQLGYTWIFVAAYCLWEAIRMPMHHIVINSFNEDVGIEILNRMDFILARLPEEIQPVVGRTNTQQKEFIHLIDGVQTPSIIQVIPATEKGAQSKTPTILIIDESCQNRYVRKTFTASKPGIDAARGKIIIISNSIKDAPGWGFTKEIYVGSMKGENTFHRIFLSWQANPNRPNNFREIQLREGMDEEDFRQRYPESESEAISAISGSYFGDTLARHEQGCVHGVAGRIEKDTSGDLAYQPIDKGICEVWRYPYYLHHLWDGQYWERRYAIGSDVSEGLGQSYSVAYVIDRLYDELVCRMRSNRLDAVEWATALYTLSRYYCNASKHAVMDPALICVERTGAGQTTVKELLKVGANQYVRLIAGKVGSPVTKEFGWHESEQSKHELCGDLKNWLRTTKGGLYDALLIEECSHTIKHEGTNRIGPEDETYLWDCVVAAGCTIQASLTMEGPPKRIEIPVTGWLKRLRESKQGSPWAV